MEGNFSHNGTKNASNIENNVVLTQLKQFSFNTRFFISNTFIDHSEFSIMNTQLLHAAIMGGFVYREKG